MEQKQAATLPRPQSSFFMARLARGDYSLARSFWLFYTLGSIIMATLCVLGIAMTASGSPAIAVLVIVLGIAQLVWAITCMFGVWRAAGRYQGFRLWPILARTWVLLHVVFILLSFFVQMK